MYLRRENQTEKLQKGRGAQSSHTSRQQGLSALYQPNYRESAQGSTSPQLQGITQYPTPPQVQSDPVPHIQRSDTGISAPGSQHTPCESREDVSPPGRPALTAEAAVSWPQACDRLLQRSAMHPEKGQLRWAEMTPLQAAARTLLPFPLSFPVSFSFFCCKHQTVRLHQTQLMLGALGKNN